MRLVHKIWDPRLAHPKTFLQLPVPRILMINIKDDEFFIGDRSKSNQIKSTFIRNTNVQLEKHYPPNGRPPDEKFTYEGKILLYFR